MAGALYCTVVEVGLVRVPPQVVQVQELPVPQFAVHEIVTVPLCVTVGFTGESVACALALTEINKSPRIN